MHDVCIVGAGPAGLNAALILGRCGRDVVVYDSGQPRNAVSQGLHGYLSRDGIHPQELRTLGREEVAKYPSVRLIDAQIATAHRSADHFELTTAAGDKVTARILLLATGRVDVLPDRPGFREFYGRGVYHCPYCDGWEHRGKRILVHGPCPEVVDFALTLLTWSSTVAVAPVDPGRLEAEDRERLQANGVTVTASPIARLVGDAAGKLHHARLLDGAVIDCEAVFFTADLPQKSPLAQSLGCELDDGGSVVCRQHAATGVPGLYVAGNVRGGVHLAIMAAAEGAEAAIAINEELADRALRGPARTTPLDQRPGARIPGQPCD